MKMQSAFDFSTTHLFPSICCGIIRKNDEGDDRMPNYAWYYMDHSSDTCYWCYSSEMSTTDFASRVSSQIGKRISASDTSYASNSKDLEKHQNYAKYSIHVD